jgi:hypothetical protein
MLTNGIYNNFITNNVDTRNDHCGISDGGDRCIDYSNNFSSKELDTELCKKSDKNPTIHVINDNEIKQNIFRFKFSDDFTIILSNFAKIHQYDNRHDFKEAWKKWLDENEEEISIEVRRLNVIGYNGDILDKMFKSARYYFRKKSTEKKAPKTRRQYIGVRKEFLDCIDSHIYSNIKNDTFKPSFGFEEFCKNNIDLLKIEIKNICKNNLIDHKDIENKFKKTYKNRYFIITNLNMNKNNI